MGEKGIHTTIIPMGRSHVNAVVDIHLDSFQGFFLAFLGRKFLKLYYEGILRNADGIGFVALNGNAIAGFVAGFTNPKGFYKRLLRSDWIRFGLASLPALLRKPNIVFRLLRAFRKPSESPQREAVELSSIAVPPGEQGSGTGGDLMTAFLDEAKRRGASFVYLTTDALNNERVKEFYQRRGFELVRTFVTPEKRAMCEYRFSIK